MREMSKDLDVFLRFAITGCIAVAVQYAVYFLLLWVASHNIAYICGYLMSFVVNYLLTTSFTFHRKRSPQNGIGFIFCHILNFIFQLLLLNLFIDLDIDKRIALLPVLAICVPTNFLMVRFVMKRY